MDFRRLDENQLLSSLTPFVGREQELALLQEHLARTEDGQSACLILQGSPGSGKSRLFQKFIRSVPVLPHQLFLESRCLPSFSEPGQPLRALFLELSRIGKQQDLLSSWLGEEAASLKQFLQPPSAIEEPFPWIVDAEQQEKLLNGLNQFLFRACQHYTLICFLEDLHWGDDLTLHWLWSLAASLQHPPQPLPLLLLGSLTPDVHLERVSSFQEAQGLSMIPLAELSAADSKRLLETMLDDVLPPDWLLDRLAWESAGHPIRMRELLFAWGQRGWISHGPQGWTFQQELSQPPEEPLQPDSSPYLALLSPLEREILALLSVAQGALWASEVRRLLHIPPIPFSEALGRLNMRHLVLPAFAHQDSLYCLQHDRLLHRCLAEFPEEQLQHYHEALGQLREEQGDIALAANHFAQSPHPERALPLFLQSGLSCAHLAEYNKAILFFEEGLTLVDQSDHLDSEMELDLWLSLASARVEIGELDVALGELDDMAPRTQTPEQDARLLALRSSIRHSQGDLFDAVAGAQRAVELASYDPWVNTRALRVLADVASRNGEQEEALRQGTSMLETARTLGEPSEERRALLTMGAIYFRLGENVQARSCWEPLTEHSQPDGSDLEAQARLLLLSPEEASLPQLARELLSLKHLLGEKKDLPRKALVDALLGSLLYHSRHFSDAIPPLQESLELSQQLAHLALEVQTLPLLASSLIQIGDEQNGASFLQHALQRVEEQGTLEDRLMAQICLRDILFYQGDHEGAQRTYQQAQLILQRFPYLLRWYEALPSP